jgi:class 3 adenylate cyclase
MSEGQVERRLAAILAADAVGYSRLMATDEEGTFRTFRALLHDLIGPKIAEHRGRIVKTTGDGLLAEFQSVVDALRSAVEIQNEMAERNGQIAVERQIKFRIGIHQGDIIADAGDIFGDGVNIAARLEALAKPGRICVSERVQQDTAGRLEVAFDDLGPQILKNIPLPVRAFHVDLIGGSTEPAHSLKDLTGGRLIDRAAPRADWSLFGRACLALVAVVVVYVLTAKAFGIFLGRYQLLAVWFTAIIGFWLLRRAILARAGRYHRLDYEAKPGAPAGNRPR